METVQHWFEQFGYGLLFIGFFLDYIAMPFPGQTVLLYAGYLSHEGVLYAVPAIALACIGSTAGLMVTYGIGHRAGSPFVRKYGKWLMLREERMDKMTEWLERRGRLFLIVVCFFPGLRQVAGYFCGVIRLPFRIFAWCVSLSALLWTAGFVTLGYLFAPELDQLFAWIDRYHTHVLLAFAGVLVLYIAVRLYGRAIRMKKRSDRQAGS